MDETGDDGLDETDESGDSRRDLARELLCCMDELELVSFHLASALADDGFNVVDVTPAIFLD